MRRLYLATIGFLLVFAGVCALAAQKPESPIEVARQASVFLKFKSGTCSGTVIGPRAVISAAHCRVDGNPVSIDGRHVTVRAVMDDGKDHVIYLLNEYFPTRVKVGRLPKLGDPVFIIAAPNGMPDLYRAGTYSGRFEHFHLYDFNGWFGDSGGGVFNAKGELIAVHSGFLSDYVEIAGAWRIQAEYGLAFTAEEWARAAK